MKIKIWDHARFVVNKEKPYPELKAMFRLLADNGVSHIHVYLPEIRDLREYCMAAGEAGITVDAWVNPARELPNPPMRQITEEQMEEMYRTQGIRLKGPCPNHPEYKRQMLEVVGNKLADYGDVLNGIHLDFIRSINSMLAEMFPCGCEACRALRKKYFGFEMPTEKDRQMHSYIYKEHAILNRHITETVAAIHQLTLQAGKQLSMAARSDYANSADIWEKPVWGIGPAVLEGQDWADWGADGIVDAINTMNYHTNFEYFLDNMRTHLRLMEGAKAELSPGLAVQSSMGTNEPDAFEKRMQAIYESGAKSLCIFCKPDTYSPEYLRIIKKYSEM